MWWLLIPAGIAILRSVIGLIKDVEQEFGSGRGQLKKAAVLTTVKSGVNFANTVGATHEGKPLPSDLIADAVASTVDELVGLFHESGIFAEHTPAGG